MGVKERKLREKNLLRQEILSAASELFVKEGYENVSMRRVADKIEYSPTTIYLYFTDKADLLHQVCNDTFSRLAQNLERILAQPGDPLQRLRRGLHAYVHFGLENPHHYRASFMMPPPANFDKSRHTRPDSPGMKAFDFLRRSVFDCAAASLLRSNDTESVSQTLWCGIHGVTSLLITHPAFPWIGKKHLIDSVVETLVAGVSQPGKK